ncbi:MAG: hypothetical protein BAJALOKI2v1_50022 [Promethearchaeota archaeon]|nr:MAG: hypothetical protein BAJALOKI2v1_50022 [Candidatus Lokiarchaeota archaeon]
MSNNIDLFILEGKDYVMGLKQGSTFQTQIKQLYEELTSSEEFLASKPFFMPKFLYRKLTRRFSSKMIKEPLKRHFPSQWSFLKGLSVGADLGIDKLLFLQAIDAIGTQISNYRIKEDLSFSFNNCSAVGIKKEKSDTEGVLIIKNWDGPEFLANYTIFRNIESLETKKFQNVGSGVVGLVGINNGMNERGLSIVYNYAYPKEIGKRGVPSMILIRKALETCTTVEETFQLFKKYPRIGGANIMVGDREGDLAVLEIGPSNIEIRRGDFDGISSFLICTNHYLSPKMRDLEVSRKAVYDDNAAEAFRSKPVHESSLMRYRDAYNILTDKSPEKLSLKFLNKEIQCSHGPDNNPSEYTFCNHGKPISTGFGVMIDIGHGQFYATIGNPCKGKMEQLIEFY